MTSSTRMLLGAIPEIDSWVKDRWSDWPVGAEQRGPSCVLKGTRQERIAIFYFSDGRRTPDIVVKLAGHAVGDAAAKREFSALGALRAALPASATQGVPIALGLYETEVFSAVSMSAVAGKRFQLPDLARANVSSFGRRAVVRYLRAAETVSLALAGEALGDAGTNTVAALSSPIAEFRSLGSLSAPAQDRLEGLERALSRHEGRINLVWQHGDVAPGNLLLARSGPRLIDWEAARPDHVPWFDRAYSWLTLARLTQRQSAAWSVPRTLVHLYDRSGWLATSIRQGIRERWPYPIPSRWVAVLGAVELARTYGDLGVEVWTPYVDALLCDETVRARCGWLVPSSHDLE